MSVQCLFLLTHNLVCRLFEINAYNLSGKDAPLSIPWAVVNRSDPTQIDIVGWVHRVNDTRGGGKEVRVGHHESLISPRDRKAMEG